MAFKLENFGSEVANAKSIIGGNRFYTYKNVDSDDLTTAGYFPAILGLKKGDIINIVPNDDALGEIVLPYYVDTIVDGVITCAQQAIV